jgi:hypothetical protein
VLTSRQLLGVFASAVVFGRPRLVETSYWFDARARVPETAERSKDRHS